MKSYVKYVEVSAYKTYKSYRDEHHILGGEISILPIATYEAMNRHPRWFTGLEVEFSRNCTWPQPEPGTARDTHPFPHYP